MEGQLDGVKRKGSGDDPESCSVTDTVSMGIKNDGRDALTFGVRDNPPFHISCLYALQIVMSHIHGPLSAAFVVHTAVCGEGNPLLLAHIVATSCFLTGLCTILQVTFGLRLPVTQVSSSAFLPPIIALMSASKCPDVPTGGINATTMSTALYDAEPWVPRIQQISGGLIMASLTEVVLGMTGMIGLLMHFIGPLTIGSCVSLVAISLIGPATNALQAHWGIAFMTTSIAVISSQVLGWIMVPVPTWSQKSGITTRRYPLIKMFAHMFAYSLPWLLCFILTITDVFPNDPEHPSYLARTDAKIETVHDMNWFYIPYPGQWGAPKFGMALFVGMFSATISSMLESVGDYHATTRVCEEPEPPKHAINRAIAMEGLGGLLSGMFGLGYSTTSYSNCIGMISYTGVASRVAWYIAGTMFILMAVIGKVAAALASVPEPILGGAMVLSLAMVLMVGINNLQHVKMASARNQTVFGLAVILGILVPRHIVANPGVIKTGSAEVDQALGVILESGPSMGGILAAILDNLLPGTRAERGMPPKRSAMTQPPQEVNKVTTSTSDTDTGSDVRSSPEDIYRLPLISTRTLSQCRVFRYMPFLPSYDPSLYACACKRAKVHSKMESRGSKENIEKMENGSSCLKDGTLMQNDTKF